MTRRLRRFGVALLVLTVPTLALGADYAATYSSAPFRVCPNREITVPVTVTNTGEHSWEVIKGKPTGDPRFTLTSDYPYLTYHLEDTKTGITTYDLKPTFLPQSVSPGQSITVDMRVAAPSPKSGPYRIHWDMGTILGLFSQEHGVPTGVVPLQSVSWLACLADRVARIPSRNIDTITALIFDGPAIVEPEKTYSVTGIEFGTAKPSLSLTAAGFTGGPLALDVLSWSDTQISFYVPHRCGERDQDAELRLTTATGNTASYGVRFVAKRQQRTVNQDQMQVVACQSPGSGRHRCNAVGTGPIGARDLTLETHMGVTGQHQSLLADQSATDEFSVPLVNGWKIVGVAACSEDDYFAGVLCSGGPGSPLQMHHTDNQVTVDWETGVPLDAMGYLGLVTIEGPCGVPHL